MNDDAKKKILARRAKFVAAALAGVACGKEPGSNPQPCLSIMYVGDAGPGTRPEIEDAGTPPDASPVIVPMVCLSVAMPPPDGGYVAPPRPCLSPMPPKPTPKP